MTPKLADYTNLLNQTRASTGMIVHAGNSTV
jgi:hypothetical protein